jgi:membrane associated rhomboid family serine protease
VLPYRDDNPTRRRPVITLVLLAINIGVFALLQFHGRTEPVVDLPTPVSSFDLELNETSFLYARAAIPCEVLHLRPLRVAEITRTLDTGQENSCGKATDTGKQFQVALFPQKSIWISILSSMFFHGDLMHLAGNMLFLWIFGNNVEDRWGRIQFLAFYLIGGVVATLGHALAAPSSTVPLVGASGAIAAVMGAYLVLFPKVKIRALLAIIPIRVPAWLLLGVWFVSQFYIAPTSGVAWMAHVVGFAFGIVVAMVFRNVGRPVESPSALRLRF